MKKSDFFVGSIAVLLVPFVIAIVALPVIFLQSVVIWKFYMWFVLPIFHTPSIAFYQVVGLVLATKAIKDAPKRKEKTEEINLDHFKEFGINLVYQIATPLIVLIVGWLFKVIFL